MSLEKAEDRIKVDCGDEDVTAERCNQSGVLDIPSSRAWSVAERSFCKEASARGLKLSLNAWPLEPSKMAMCICFVLYPMMLQS